MDIYAWDVYYSGKHLSIKLRADLIVECMATMGAIHSIGDLPEMGCSVTHLLAKWPRCFHM